MKKWWLILGGILMGIGILFGMHKQADAQYQFPQETDRHEGIWLVWQHSHTYGRKYAKEIEPIWLKMTKALAPGERVHIVAYDQSAKKKIQAKLAEKRLSEWYPDKKVAPINVAKLYKNGGMIHCVTQQQSE